MLFFIFISKSIIYKTTKDHIHLIKLQGKLSFATLQYIGYSNNNLYEDNRIHTGVYLGIL